MKISVITFMFFFLSAATLSAQEKPVLPVGYYTTFNYLLPKGFDSNDSAQIVNEVFKVATEIRNFHITAQANYRHVDSAAWYNFLDRTISVNALLNQHQDVADAIRTCRQLKKATYFEAPYRLSQLAYSEACLLHTDDASDAFKKIYAQKLIEQFELIDPAFRSDIVNRQKGLNTPQLTQLYWRNLKRLFEHASTKNNGNLAYNTAQHDIIPTCHAYNQTQKYRSLIDSVLYALSPSVIKTQTVAIPLRDGLHLRGVIYKDSLTVHPLPAIVSVSPYTSGGGDPIKGNVFASNGYIYVYADARGRGESEGSFVPFEHDAQDMYDIIDWVSKQSWCSGKVAMSGGSYLGFSQWQAIRKGYKHPALKAINPMVSVGFGVDFPRENNMFYSFILPWAVYVSGRQPNHALYSDTKFWNSKYYEHYKKQLPFSKLDSVAGMPNVFFQKWISHPDFDEYWKAILPSPADYKGIDIPIFTITGYYDGDQAGALYYYNQHQQFGSSWAKQNHYLLIGPYDHGGAQWVPEKIQGGYEIETNAQIPIYKYAIWWFDWVLKGKKKPSFLKSNITYFEAGNNRWEGARSFTQLTTDSLVLYLTNATKESSRRKDLYLLDTNKPSGHASIKYEHDISAVLDSAYLFTSAKTAGDSIYMSSYNNLVFESLPLKKDIIISNKIISRIYASLNVPDADFEVIIKEINENGKEHNLANGKIRVRYRDGNERASLVKQGEVVLLNIDDVHFYIRKVSKGSSIRLVFQSVNNPRSEKNWGLGGEVSKESTTEPRIIEAIIYTGGQYKSKLLIPYKN